MKKAAVQSLLADMAGRLSNDDYKPLVSHFPALVEIEDIISTEIGDPGLDMVSMPKSYRIVVDLLSLARSLTSRKEVEYEHLLQRSEISARSNRVGQKITVGEARALAFEDVPELLDLHMEVETMRVLVEHLREVKNLALMRKDILIERSIDLRKQRDEDSRAID